MAILDINGLTIHYLTDDGRVCAVNDISLSLDEGDTLGLVGETGAGKTTTALGIMRLIPNPPGKVISGSITFDGRDILELPEAEMRKIRGEQISMIFQDPMTALNPVLRVDEQIAENIRQHTKCSRRESLERALEMLETAGIPASRGSEYPHQFSGGMKQRVVIAMALACTPKLLIADEPTTALDVTIQAQVLDMMTALKEKFQTTMIMITHDLGVVAEVCSKVAIMYAGEIVEYGTLEDIFLRPSHPYTNGLFGSLPSINTGSRRLRPIAGLMPDPSNLPEGCNFAPRCPHCTDRCTAADPATVEVSPGHLVKCLTPDVDQPADNAGEVDVR